MFEHENRNFNFENIEPVINEEEIPDTEFDIDEQETEVIVGVVTDCLKLNVREKPKTDAKVLSIVPDLSELLINQDLSTDGWFSVFTEDGVEGFCMKKFVALRQ